MLRCKVGRREHLAALSLPCAFTLLCFLLDTGEEVRDDGAKGMLLNPFLSSCSNWSWIASRFQFLNFGTSSEKLHWTGFASELNQLPCAFWSWYQKENCRSLLSTSLSLFFLDYAIPGHLIWFFLHLLSQVSSAEDGSECQENVKSSIYCYPSIRETTWGPYSDLLKSCLDDCGGLVYSNLASAMSTIATYLL